MKRLLLLFLLLPLSVRAVTSYVTTTGNDATFVRGDITHPAATISNAVHFSLSGDAISIAAGTYNVTNRITLLQGMNMFGASRTSTIVTNWVIEHNAAYDPGSGTGACFLPGDNSSISNLWVVNVEAIIGGTDFQAALGTSSHFASPTDPGFTNVTMSIRVLGTSDNVFIDTTNHCDLIIYNPQLQSTWDLVAVISTNAGANHNVTIYGGSLTNKGVDANGSIEGGLFIVGTNNNISCYGTIIYSDKSRGVVADISDACTLTLSSCVFDMPNSPSQWLDVVSGNYACVVTLIDCDIPNNRIFAPQGVTIIRVSSAATINWLHGYGGTLSDNATSVAVDTAGNIYVCGYFKGTANFGGTNLVSAGGQTLFVAKYDSLGVHQWSAGYGSTGDESPYSICVDPGGSTYISGYFTGTANFGGTNMTPAGQYDGFLAKYNSNGGHVWSMHLGSTSSTTYIDTFYGCAIDSQTNVLVTGAFQGTFNLGGTNMTSLFGTRNPVLAKYASDGTHVWSKTFPANSTSFGYSVAVNAVDSVVLVGSFLGSINLGGGNILPASPLFSDFYIGKFASSGAFTWGLGHGGTNTDTALSVSLDSNGDALVTGAFYKSTDLGGGTITGGAVDQDMYIAKYSGVNGAFVWGNGTVGNFGEFPQSVRADSQGNAIVAGYYYGSCNFGVTTLNSVANSYDIFITSYTSNGLPSWASSFGGPTSDGATSVTTDLSGRKIMVGSFSGTANFGTNVLVSTGSSDAFIASFTPPAYFVDVATGNDSNSGSQLSPWKHIPGSQNGTVTNVIPAGSYVVVKGGTTNYSRVEVNHTNYTGAAGYNSITIQSGHLYSSPWGTGRAIIDAGGTNTAGFGLSGSLATGPLNGITLDGFEVRNIAAGAAGPGYDNTVGSSCILAGSANYPANWLTIKHCYLHDAARSVDDTGHGIEFAGGGTNFVVAQNIIGPAIGTKGIEPYTASFGVISNNYISGTGDHCIALSLSTNVDVCFNTIRNDPPWVHEPQFALAMAGSKNNDIYDNLIFRGTFPVTNTIAGRSGMGIGIYGICISNRIALNTIANFNDPANAGSFQTAVTQEKTATNSWTEYYNNLIISNYNSLGAIGFCANTDSTLSNRMAFCDVFATTGTEPVMDAETGLVDAITNVANYHPACGIYTNNQQLTPSFIGGTFPSGVDSSYHPNSGYFGLAHASPVVIWHTGNTNTPDAVHGYVHASTKYAQAIDGIPRISWSMGAYELNQNDNTPYTNVSTFISGKVLIGGRVLIK